MPEFGSAQTLPLPFAHADLVCLHAPVQDLTHTLTAAESAAISSAVDKRRKEYATGRWLAHRALSQLGLSIESILSGEKREPVWPESTVGSITHADGLVAVAVSAKPNVLGVGIDLERAGRVGDLLLRKILTQRERQQLGDLDPTLIFSAKEACYKVLFPIFREYVPFQAVEIPVDESKSTFTMRYLGDRPDHAVIERARGSYQRLDGCWLTLVVLEAPAEARVKT